MAAAQTPQQQYDELFVAGMKALESSPDAAQRAFARCRELAAELPPERRAAGAFAAGLLLAETKWRARQSDDAAAYAELHAVAGAARDSGAWTGERAEGLRLRALVWLWQTAAQGAFRREIEVADREWLLRDDFFAIEPRLMQALFAPARVLRFQLAQGTQRELATLRELVGAEEKWAAIQQTGHVLAGDDLTWRDTALDALARYHAERRSLDRAQVYADRMTPKESLGVRALLALQREDHEQAKVFGRQLVAARSADGHQVLAEACEASGEPAEALRHYGEVLRAAQDPLLRAAASNGRGDCLLQLERLDEAGAAYAEALAACGADTVGAIAERAETKKDLGRLEEKRGHASKALAHFLQALELGEHAREKLLSDPFGGSWLRIHADQTTGIDGVLRTFRAAGGDPWLAVHALELGRARGSLDLAGRGAGHGVDPVLLRGLVERRLVATEAHEAEGIAAELDALRAHASTVASHVVVPGAAELREFAARHAHATILSWWLGREQAWLVVIRGGSVDVFDLPEPAQCRKHVVLAYAATATPDGDRTVLAAAAECLLPSAARRRLGETVLAVLDPTMARLPLAALPLDGVPFGIGRVVVQAPSLSVARLLTERVAGGTGAIVLQAPERGELPQRLGLDPLAFAARETAAVARRHAAVVQLRDDAATWKGLADAITTAPPAVLHLAVHAVDCPGLPTQSLLLLADGPLAMVGLGELSLPGSLVVFSACAAAVGEQRGHEGGVGLVEGAFAAGARTVVAPVAAVNQQATADLMAQLHERLARGDDAATALQAARAMLAAAPNYSHPHYWGTFAVFGGIPAARATAERPVASAWRWWGLCGLVAIGVLLLLPRQQRRVGPR